MTNLTDKQIEQLQLAFENNLFALIKFDMTRDEHRFDKRSLKVLEGRELVGESLFSWEKDGKELRGHRICATQDAFVNHRDVFERAIESVKNRLFRRALTSSVTINNMTTSAVPFVESHMDTSELLQSAKERVTRLHGNSDGVDLVWAMASSVVGLTEDGFCFRSNGIAVASENGNHRVVVTVNVDEFDDELIARIVKAQGLAKALDEIFATEVARCDVETETLVQTAVDKLLS